MKEPVYIDLVSDYAFKRIFGSEPNKDLLISLLNGLFRGRKSIVDLLYEKNEHVGDNEEIGTVIFDLICTADNGEKFVIEVQRTAQINLKKRMLYYSSKIIADQAPKGNRRGKHQLSARKKQPLEQQISINQKWNIDFMSHRLADGNRFGIF